MSNDRNDNDNSLQLLTMEDLRRETELRDLMAEAWACMEVAAAMGEEGEAERWAFEMETLESMLGSLEMSGEVGFACLFEGNLKLGDEVL